MTDVVIAWVDGDDPAHKCKKAKYLTGKDETRFDDIAGAMRYRSTGEVYYCVASVLRYAPWVRKIFIVHHAKGVACIFCFKRKGFCAFIKIYCHFSLPPYRNYNTYVIKNQSV